MVSLEAGRTVWVLRGKCLEDESNKQVGWRGHTEGAQEPHEVSGPQVGDLLLLVKEQLSIYLRFIYSPLVHIIDFRGFQTRALAINMLEIVGQHIWRAQEWVSLIYTSLHCYTSTQHMNSPNVVNANLCLGWTLLNCRKPSSMIRALPLSPCKAFQLIHFWAKNTRS